jgi:hypothetical protein
MQRWVGPALGAVAVALVGWNTWSLRGIEQRLEALESAAPAVTMKAAGPRGGGGARAGGPQAAPAPTPAQIAQAVAASGESMGDLDLADPEVQERLATIVEEQQKARRAEEEQERSQQFLDSVTEEVRAFAEEYNLKSEDTESVLAEIEHRSASWNAVRSDVRDGNISWFDARRELEAVREESDANLREVLGDENFDALDARLWGDRGGRGF